MYWVRPSDVRIVEEAILARRTKVKISLDLGLNQRELLLDHGLVIAPDGQELAMPALKKDEKTCFFLDDEFKRIRFFGDQTGMVYELVETAGRPMLKVSATPFHKWDFIKRIEHDKLTGNVLDAGTGLGYTAIAAAQTAREVVTVELDPHVLQVQQLNPWSKELDRKNITLVHADILDYLRTCKEASFDVIILDGGMPRTSGLFFSQQNYNEVRRVLRKGGTLYHYLPDKGAQRGRDFPAEVILRIKKAGFKTISRFAEQNYVVCR